MDTLKHKLAFEYEEQYFINKQDTRRRFVLFKMS